MEQKFIMNLILISGLFVLVGCVQGEDSEKSMDNTERQTNVNPLSAKKPERDTLPLLRIMINLEQNMNAIQAGMWRGNYQRIRSAAEGIGHHAKIPTMQIQKLKGILGSDEFKKFVQDDKTVHQTALGLAEAAKEKNLTEVTDRYVDLYQGCVSCHINYRKKIRSSPKW